MSEDSQQKSSLPSGESWLSMSEASPLTPYSTEYLSLLARKGKLPSKKIQNTWYTTKLAVDEYMKKQMLRAQIQNGNFQSLGQPVTPNVTPVVDYKSLPPISPMRSYHGDIKKHFPVPQPIPVSIPRVEIPKEIPKEVSKPVHTEVSHVEQALERVLDKKLFNQKKVNNLSVARHVKTAVSSKLLVATTLGVFVLFSVLPLPVVFSFADRSVSYVKEALMDANTLMGFRAGTHASEILLLDKQGNISIMGHIETEGQLRSFAKQGIAPIVVDSTSTVANLSADYVDGVSAGEFTLAFVTKNGSVTTEDVRLLGDVEVGKTLSVVGATKLLSTLEVGEELQVLGEAEFKQTVSVGGDLDVDRNISVRGSIEAGSAVIARSGSFSALSAGASFQARGKVVLGDSKEYVTVDAKNFTINKGGDAEFDGTVTASNFSGNILQIVSASSTYATTTNATSTNLYVSGLASSTEIRANTSFLGYITSVFGDFTDLLVNGSTTLQNLTFTNATGTSATSTNLFATNASTTNFWSNIGSIGNLASTFGTFANFLVNGSTTLQNFTAQNSTTTNATSSTFAIVGDNSGLLFTGTGSHDIVHNAGTLRIATSTFLGTISASNNTINIGSAGTRFKTIYADEVNASTIVGTLTGGNLTAETFNINSDNSSADTEDAFLSFERGSVTPNALLSWDSTNDRFTFNSDLALLGGINNGSLFVNSSTTLQNFTASNSTSTNATTTSFAISNLTSTRIPFVTTGGALIDSSNLTYDLASGRLTTVYASTTALTSSGSAYFATSGGNVGIGTTNPLSKFNIRGSADINLNAEASGSVFDVAATNDANNALIPLQLRGSAIYMNPSGGNVGIGTTNPLATLSVTGSFLTTSSSTLQNFTFQNATGTSATTTNFFSTTASSTNLFSSLLSVAGTSGLNVIAGGNVGVGSSTPFKKFVVSATAGDLTSNSGLRVTRSDSATQYVDIYPRNTYQENGMAFDVSGNDSIFVSSTDGDVVIGGMSLGVTSAPASKFTVNGGVNIGYVANTAAPTDGLLVEGNVGIGLTNPAYKLDVSGSGAGLNLQGGNNRITFSGYRSMEGATDGSLLQLGEQYARTALYGNVGVGTTTPSTKLHVVNNAISLPSFDANDLNFVISDTAHSGMGIFSANTGSGLIYFGDTDANARGRIIYDHTDDNLSFGTAGAEKVRITSGGSVGIGTTNPGEKLDIRDGRLHFSNASVAHGVTSQLATDVSFATGYLSSTTGGAWNMGISSGDNTAYRVQAVSGSSGTNPVIKLDAYEKSGVGTFSVDSTAQLFEITNAGTGVLNILGNGNVGIGTTNPSQKLEVSLAQNALTQAQVTNTTDGTSARSAFTAQMSTASNGGLISMQAISPSFTAVPTWTNTGALVTGISGGMVLSAFDASGIIRFQTGGNDTANERMRITSGGNIGIGTTNPQALLDVLGTASSTLYYANAGTNSAPSYSFASDPNTGIYRPATDQLAITTGGTQRVLFDDNGFVGIGTSPSYRLHVADNTANGRAISAVQTSTSGSVHGVISQVSGAATTNTAGYFSANNASTNYGVFINSPSAGANNWALYSEAAAQSYFAGNVGIGTTNPGALLDVRGSAVFNEDGSDADFRIESDTNANLLTIDAGQNNIGFGAAPNGRYFADFGGAGTTAFTSQATAANDSAFILVRPASVANTSGTGNLANVIIAGTSLNPTGASTWGSSLQLSASGEAGAGSFTNMASLYIDGSPSAGSNNYSIYSAGSGQSYFAGNVGIGVTNPNVVLDISSAQAGVEIVSTTATNNAYTRYDNNGGSFYIGRDNSAGGSLLTGSSAYAAVFGSAGAYPMQFGTNDTVRMTIGATGNVGIGNTAPSSKFHVQSTSGSASNSYFTTADYNDVNTGSGMLLDFGATSGNTYTRLQAFSNGSALTNNLALNPNGGNVGIGTTAPLTKLQVGTTAVGGTVPSSTVLLASLSGESGGMGILTDNDRSGLLNFGDPQDDNRGYLEYAHDVDQMRFGVSAATKMVIDSTGNVGVGTTNPGGTLELANSGVNFRLNRTGTGYWDHGVEGVSFGLAQTFSAGQLNSGFLFRPRNDSASQVDALAITGQGNVGIGTTTPQHVLTSYSSSAPQLSLSAGAGVAQWAFRNAGGNLYFATTTVAGNATTSTSALSIIGSTGNIGIGSTTPMSKLTVAGDFRVAPTSESTIPISATGGTITTSGSYTIHTFTSSGTFSPNGAVEVEYLVVAGGGGGGGRGGGGGAGGMATGTISVSAGDKTVTVGTGGTAGVVGVSAGGNGGDSVFSSITAVGGGGGGSAGITNNGAEGKGSNGGSGGGSQSSIGIYATGTAGQGNNGGGGGYGSIDAAGGGGGAGAVGETSSAFVAANGGAGAASSISGASVTYAGGGGGGANATGGTGGTGGGGGSGNPGVAGTANTGGGGGGGNSGYSGGAGGSGIVIVRYLTAATVTASSSGFYIDSSGLVGIGTTTPLVTAHVYSNLDINIFRLQDADGTCNYNPESGSVTVSCSSDARLKTNIRDTASALEYFSDLKIRDYTVLASGNQQTGLIAQEALETNPELVTMGDDGYYQVSEVSSWKLIRGIQELDKKFEDIIAFGNLDESATSTATSTEMTVQAMEFASRFFDSITTKMTKWFASATNGIGDFFANRVRTKTLCIGDEDGSETCITKSNLDSLLASAGVTVSALSSSPSTDVSEGETASSTTSFSDVEIVVETATSTEPISDIEVTDDTTSISEDTATSTPAVEETMSEEVAAEVSSEPEVVSEEVVVEESPEPEVVVPTEPEPELITEPETATPPAEEPAI